MSSIDFSKPYSPNELERGVYARWSEAGYFRAVNSQNPSGAYCIAIPPPNVTGSLHMGHALMVTLQDVLIRYHRMTGKNALWIPGIDHAGISTQVVVERELRRENLTRHDLGREAFVARVWTWKAQSGDRIYEQIKVLGASCDWDRARFTMDPEMSRAVREAFVRLYEEGLIYRSKRLVNWSIKAQTVISDLEVTREEPDPKVPNAELFSFAYTLEDGSGEIVVATTRPETMVGDTAIAVHPEDPRYKHLVGKRVVHPFVPRSFAIIADGTLADPAKGTGAVKVTPAHDFNDYACGKRNGLEEISILNLDGTLNANAGPFAGMDRFVAREAVKKALEAKGLARGSAPHSIPYARCQRTQDILEPVLSLQWYVKTAPLAEPAVRAVQDGRVSFVPEEWTKTYMHWMTDIQDWCISRQLWWGHQIPAWDCARCGHVSVSRADPTVCQGCGSTEIHRDPDVLDTWFSSALWPFATLGWPDETPALKTFYPNAVMETGFDIIFFWVARMMMMGLHFMGEVPFRKVLLHGMVCDETGTKMSKVKGNVIDPLDLVYGARLEEIIAHASGGAPFKEALEKFKLAYPSVAQMKDGFAAFGADAVRFYLASHPPQTRKINLKLPRLQGYRDFCNKIWNATRFSLTHIHDVTRRPRGDFPRPPSVAERWVLSRLAHTIDKVRRGIEDFRLDEATSALYQFFWYELCDWFLELSKPVFEAGTEPERASYKLTLAHALECALRLFHPFMPHLSEETWSHLPDNIRVGRGGEVPASLMIASFPDENDAPRDPEAESAMGRIQGSIEAVRRIAGELGIKAGAAITVHLRATDPAALESLRDYLPAIKRMTRAREVVTELLTPDSVRPKGVGYAMAPGIEVMVPLAGHIDPASEGKRLEKDLAKVCKEADGIARRIENPDFVARAPVEVVDKDKARLAELKDREQRILSAIDTVNELSA